MQTVLDLSDVPYFWLIVIITIAVVFGSLGYFISSRSIKQPLISFLLRFTVTFLSLMLIESLFLSFVPSVHGKLCDVTTTITGGVLSSIGVSESVSGDTIALNNPFLVFRIDAACLGGILLWAYTGLVFAESRVTLKQRLVGIIFGLAIILGFNFFRIVTSIYLEWRTGVHVHDYFYIVNMALVLLVWAGWLKILKPNQAVARPASKQQVISGVKSE